MKKGKWQSKDEQNVEVPTGPVMHNNSIQETERNEIQVLTSRILTVS